MYDHPISKRIIEFQTLIKKLEAVERRFRSRLDGLVLEMKTQDTTSQSKSARHKSSKRQTLNDDCSANVMSVSADMSSQAVENTSTNGNKVPVTAEKVSKRKSTGKHKLSQLISDSESDEAPSSAEMPEAADFTAAVPAKKKSLRDKDQISSEKAALTYYEMMRKSKNKNVPDEDVAEESNEDDDVVAENDDADEFGAMLNDYDEETAAETTDGRRAVTKQILRNRGLTPKRKKEYKNPRVKHRLKYRKAKIRRRGQIREVRHEINPYAGELSGIRAAVKRGVRLKA
jgi:U3 small nucleolar RNA-associated protein 3